LNPGSSNLRPYGRRTGSQCRISTVRVRTTREPDCAVKWVGCLRDVLRASSTAAAMRCGVDGPTTNPKELPLSRLFVFVCCVVVLSFVV
jgi:hypothetical protein